MSIERAAGPGAGSAKGPEAMVAEARDHMRTHRNCERPGCSRPSAIIRRELAGDGRKLTALCRSCAGTGSGNGRPAGGRKAPGPARSSPAAAAPSAARTGDYHGRTVGAEVLSLLEGTPDHIAGLGRRP